MTTGNLTNFTFADYLVSVVFQLFMMNITIYFIVLSLIFTVQVSRLVAYEDDIIEMIQTAGYQSEVHKVETEDGYILKVHRVLVKKQSLIPRKPIFMMHGILSTAMDYVFKGPEKGLGEPAHQVILYVD